MRFSKIAIICGGLSLMGSAQIVLAHDLWINHGSYRSKTGEHCCGQGDCAAMDPGSVRITGAGYSVQGYGNLDGATGAQARVLVQETVPFSEAQRSEDGRYWRCHRPDGSRRCFFAPDQSM